MNELFAFAFWFAGLLNPLAWVCLIPLLTYQLPIDDLSISAISACIMFCCSKLESKPVLKSLFYTGGLIQITSLYSDYYFDYSGLNIESLHHLAYYAYLLFTPLSITINSLIIMEIIRTGRDGIRAYFAMFYMLSNRNRGHS